MMRHTLPGLAFVALIAATTASLADGLTARISTDKMAIGDTFQLTLSADPAKLTAPPDVSALNTDFDILGTSKSSQTRIINGARSDTVEWIITLAPRAQGHLTIPVLTAGQATSEALSLDVVDAADLPADQKAQGGTTITATLEPGTHYVQQETPLTLRITTGPGFQGGAISAPESPDYILTPRGEDQVSQMTSNGRPVTVIERDYLIHPQKSGTLTIAPFTLKATESDPTARSPFPSDPFDKLFGQSPFGGAGSSFGQMFNRGREVVVRTAPITLEVKAKPSASAGWFLPAKEVALTEKWNPAAPMFRVGEAVTRHIRIQALGASEVQLPDLAVPQVTGARVYLEKTESGSVDTPKGTAAVRDFTYSIVPTTGGEITLPDITVNWFDTASETARTATLAGETITVEGAATAAPAKPQPPAAAIAAPAAAGGDGDAITASDWLWAAIATVAAIAAILTAAIWFRRYRGGSRATPGHKAAPAKPTGSTQRKSALRQLKTACAASDAKAAYPAALRWLHAATPDTQMGGESLWQRFPDLRDSWHDLEARVFSARVQGDWDAPAFLRHVQGAEKRINTRPRRQSRTTLPPLYGASEDMRGGHSPA